jgi:UDP-glucose 4-epimerase
MKVVITGKNGYIATSLKAKLEQKGYAVATASFRDGAESVNLSGVDILVHCAAIVHKRERDYANLYDSVNHIEAVRLAERAKASGVKHFVFISTMSVYGVKCGEINGLTPCMPTTLYGKSKLAAEGDIRLLEDTDFRVTVVRPPMIYGLDCPGNFGLLKRLAELTPIFPKVNNKRSMIYIDNLTAELYRIIKDGIYGIITPMDKEYVNTTDMVAKIAAVGNRKIFFSSLLGKVVSAIPLRLFKKVFGDLYYADDIAAKCNYVDFNKAIEKALS